MNETIPFAIQSVHLGMQVKVVNSEYASEYPNPVTICGVEWHPIKGENIYIAQDGRMIGGWKLSDFYISQEPKVSAHKRSFFWRLFASISKKLYVFFNQSEISEQSLRFRKMALDCVVEAKKHDKNNSHAAGVSDGKACAYNDFSNEIRQTYLS